MNSSIVVFDDMREIVNRINNSDKKYIFLSAPNQGGKTTTLKLFKDSLSGNNDCIYVDYKYINYIPSLNEKDYSFYCELMLVEEILTSIKNNNSKMYSELIIFHKYILNKLNMFNNYILTGIPSSKMYDNYSPSVYINRLLEIYKISNSNKLTIIIDHYDSRVGFNERFNGVMLNCLKDFDKSIIVCSSKNKLISNEENQEEICFDYYNKAENVQYILLDFLVKFKSKIMNVVYYKEVKDINIINNLIRITNANIFSMLKILEDCIDKNISIQEFIDNIREDNKDNIDEIMFNKHKKGHI